MACSIVNKTYCIQVHTHVNYFVSIVYCMFAKKNVILKRYMGDVLHYFKVIGDVCLTLQYTDRVLSRKN